MKMEFPQVRTLVGITGGKAFTVNASDRLWAKYELGERFNITDPATKAPAVRYCSRQGRPAGQLEEAARGRSAC
jgi:hypothetical protein